MAQTPPFHINQRLSFTPGQPHTAARCTVRYAGPVEGTAGAWLGVEWDVEGKGKHSGTHSGTKYFDCKAPGNGSFIRPTRRPDDTLSFVEGLRAKYAPAGAGGAEQPQPQPQERALALTASKVFEEVGFDKIRERLGRLRELRVVILDGMCLDRADDGALIAETCPGIEELDLSRNLFESLDAVARICAALPALRALKISGNRFSSLEVAREQGRPSPFEGVTALEISNTHLTWEETTQILRHFPNIRTLESSLNRIASVPADISLPHTLTTLNLERNALTSLAAALPLTALPSLTHLILAHNRIATLHPPAPSPPAAVFAATTHLDLTFNALASLTALDDLPPLFPALRSLRLSHNPFAALLPREEAHMLALARTPATVDALNHARVPPAERANAELYYLGRVAKELALVAESEEPAVLARHRRWGELCRLHGAPRIDRAVALERRCLGAKLVEVEFVGGGGGGGGRTLRRRVPRGLAVATLRALVARAWGLEPLRVRLEMEAEGAGAGAGGRVLLGDGVRELGYYVEGGEGAALRVRVGVEA